MPRWWTLSVVDDLDVRDDERVIPCCGDEAHEHVQKMEVNEVKTMLRR